MTNTKNVELELAAAQRDKLVAWAVEQAYPWWHGQGIDHARGGFVEAFTHDGKALDRPRRARVHPRQLYSFAMASSLGWSGPSEQILRDGLAYFERCFRRPDGLVRTLVALDGSPADDSVALYDQAFAMFALLTCAKRLGDPESTARAERHLTALIASQKHPVAGFYDGPERAPALHTNPHMHLLEAALAGIAAGGGPGWTDLAGEIVELALTKFIDPASGALREYFDDGWMPVAGVTGRIVEPGHQFEWAWLLLRWFNLTGRAEAADAAFRMIRFAESHGVDHARGVAINAVLETGAAHDTRARLWPQTERIKAAAAAALHTGDPSYWAMAAEGGVGLMKYFEQTGPGLWHDMMEPNGEFSDEFAPASSLYHIVCAIAELDSAVESARASDPALA
jgi:mannose-6-phosphate isomerase